MGLEDPNCDGDLNEDHRQNPKVVDIESTEVSIDEDAQRQNEKERAAERKRKRELAKEQRA